ncbi:MAG TPA: hypothetical protein PKH77_16430 [Anaerolineae bacterium]|nr:hypothetical protein [Anaerolineae bacterium]
MKTRQNWQRWGAVGLFFGLLVGWMTLPAPLTLSTHLIGNNVDNWIFYWNDWWLAKALTTGQPVLFTPYAFFPQGASLVAHSNSFLSSLLALPLRPVVGPVAASNLVWLAGLWIGAGGMFWLTYDLTRNSAGALVAGFVFTFAPYHLTQALSHAHLGFIQWWPWYALMLRRALQIYQPASLKLNFVSRLSRLSPKSAQSAQSADRKNDSENGIDSDKRKIRFNSFNPLRKNGYALAAGIFAALTLWTGLQLAVMLALWTVGYVGWLLVRSPRALSRWMELGKRLLVVAAVAGLLSAPLLIPIARAWKSGWTEGFNEGVSHQTDLLAYLVPPTYHPLWGDQVQPIYERFIANRAYMPYLGYGVLFLAIFLNGFNGLSGWRRKKSVESVKSVDEWVFWLLTLLLWLLLSAGSALRVNGTLYPLIRLPYRWLADIFPFSTLRSPDRLNALTVFSLAALAGYGAARLRRRWALLPLGLLLLAEYLCLPLPRWELLPASPFYAQMAADGEEYAVLDYPMGYNEAKLWLYYQTLHGRPTVEGHVSRYTPELYTLITSNSLIRALYQSNLKGKPLLLPGDAIAAQAIPPEDVGAAIRELADLGVRYVLVHKPTMDAAADAHFRRILPLAPVYEDETLAVYDLTAPLTVTYDGFPMILSNDLSLIRFDVQPDADGVWRFQIVARVWRDLPVLPVCTLALAGEAASPVYTAAVEWGGFSLKAGDLAVRELSVRVDAPPGDYQWSFTCAGASYRPPEHWFVAADGARYTRPISGGVMFADTIALAGYHWRTEGALLELALEWDVLRAPGADYKLFVHLLDADGALVGQYDAIPCAWACPTSGWQAGQRIHDTATLRLWNLPAGDYRLAVGWYRPETGERLPATGVEDGYVILPEVFSVRTPGFFPIR